MAFFKSLVRNISSLSKQPTQTNTNNFGVAFTNQGEENREAIYPNWFFSSHLGQPRNIDILKLREFAKSTWTQMVITSFKKQVSTIDWNIVNEDEEDETDRSKDIKIVKDFFKNVNKNKQCIEEVHSEIITDIAEIDAGVVNYIYSSDSYTIGSVPVYNAWGQVIDNVTGLVLKPLGQRKIVGLKSVDGGTILKQVDIHKNLLNYWQYSFKHPRQNPTQFYSDEMAYIMMNPRSYDIYGFSPVQSVQQVIELLIQGTRYNKDLFKNNAIPELLINLPNIPVPELTRLKREWNKRYKGKPHQISFANWKNETIHNFSTNNRDLEWLEGQKWYFKLVFGSFGVSPEEAGFTETSNRATGDSQERVTIRNALKPYLRKFEKLHTFRTISEILGREDHGLCFKFFPKDHVAEKIEFEQSMKELEVGALTVNDYRKSKGKDPYEWGDEPLRKPFNPADSFMNFADSNNNSNDNPNMNPNDKDKDDKRQISDKDEKDKNKLFRKKFEGFLSDRKQKSHS
jgi:hypothetical protein